MLSPLGKCQGIALRVSLPWQSSIFSFPPPLNWTQLNIFWARAAGIFCHQPVDMVVHSFHVGVLILFFQQRDGPALRLLAAPKPHFIYTMKRMQASAVAHLGNFSSFAKVIFLVLFPLNSYRIHPFILCVLLYICEHQELKNQPTEVAFMQPIPEITYCLLLDFPISNIILCSLRKKNR